MNLSEAWNFGRQALQNDPEAECLCTLLLCHVLQKDRLYLHLNGQQKMECALEKAFLEGIARLQKGEPIQYITGEQCFMGLSFSVRPGVLIPRQDTETLVEELLKRLPKEQPSEILDIGAGSGAISVSLAHFLPKARVTGVDISREALSVASENARKNGVHERTAFLLNDIMREFPASEEGFDVIVSNPPYIEKEVYESLEKRVREYEPEIALTDGGDGLAFYRRIIEKASEHLKPQGLLAFEIGYLQAKAVVGIGSRFGFSKAEVLQDLGGRDRVVLFKKEF